MEDGVPRVAAGPLRESNRGRVIAALAQLGVGSRAEIARRTGLSRSTVSSIVAELHAEGLVTDREAEGAPTAQGGRPPALLALDRSAGIAVGVDFGKRHLSVGAADLSHQIIAERRIDMGEDYGAVAGIETAADAVHHVLDEAGAGAESVLGVGMGVPGPIHASGSVGSTAILPGWTGVYPGRLLAEHLGLPVHVANDANLGALSELMWGAGRGSQNFAFIKLSTGIGGALITDGRLYEGAGGTAGEIGHTTIDDAGDLCRCGNRGCLETVAGLPALLALVRRSLGEDLDGEGLVAKAIAGDLACRRAVADAGRHVGVAAANLCNVVNPERIIVGGSLGHAGDLLLDPLRESVRLRAIPSAAEDVEIVPAQLGDRAELLGAIALVLLAAGPLAARIEQPAGAAAAP